jgi:signal transduction histidine kinase
LNTTTPDLYTLLSTIIGSLDLVPMTSTPIADIPTINAFLTSLTVVSAIIVLILVLLLFGLYGGLKKGQRAISALSQLKIMTKRAKVHPDEEEDQVGSQIILLSRHISGLHESGLHEASHKNSLVLPEVIADTHLGGIDVFNTAIKTSEALSNNLINNSKSSSASTSRPQSTSAAASRRQQQQQQQQ